MFAPTALYSFYAGSLNDFVYFAALFPTFYIDGDYL